MSQEMQFYIFHNSIYFLLFPDQGIFYVAWGLSSHHLIFQTYCPYPEAVSGFLPPWQLGFKIQKTGIDSFLFPVFYFVIGTIVSNGYQ